MKNARTIGLWLLTLALLSPGFSAQSALLPQRVLYIGERTGDFEPFLKKYFVEAKSVSRADFKPAQAKDFDVVVLDWPQSGEERGAWLKGSPLGKREEWNKPTVLFGSAGLNLAVSWKLKGGSGCTCLAPVACGLKDHEIFKGPIPIDIHATTNIPMPRTFAHEAKEPTLDVLPLVENIRTYATVINDHRRGWASHYYEFADAPDVELFSGGINEQTPRSAAFWRQGNLLHFGFEQTPSELNETGRAMLVNAIAYISRFSEDRPIDITPSVFATEKPALTRRRAKNYLTGTNSHPEWATSQFTPETTASFDWKDRETATAWVGTNSMWLHPAKSNLLEIDVEAKLIGTPFDSPEFFPKVILALRDEKTRAAAVIVLNRYTTDGPGENADAGAWEKWWQENSSYLFYSEMGCYRWYIDPLAKKRGVPTKDLRGPARADIHG